MGLARNVTKVTAPIARRVRLMARRAVVRLVYDDPKMQEVQLAVFDGEVRDHVERWEDYGFTSHPLVGAEALVLALGGSTDHGAVVKVGDRRYRVTGLEAGEVCIYTDEGDRITFKRGREIVIDTQTLTINASTKVTLNTPLVETSGEVKAASDVLDQSGGSGRTMASMRSVYNSHTHPGGGGPDPSM